MKIFGVALLASLHVTVEASLSKENYVHELLFSKKHHKNDQDKSLFKNPFIRNKLKEEAINRIFEEEDDDDEDEVVLNAANVDKSDKIFAYVPDAEMMDGVEPYMTQLCSTISAQVYYPTVAKKEDFKLSTKDHEAEAILFDDHGIFKNATCPFVIVTCGDKLILGWRGTNTHLDMLNDAALSPQASFAWKKHAKTIKAQGAMTSVVMNDIVNHEDFIIEEVKKRGIKEIITTGQSLGGGCGQIAHLILRAQIQDESSPWHELKDDVNVRSVVFCAPMTTVLIDNASPETDAFVKEIADNSANFVYMNDVVPRGYGYLKFVEDLLENATPSLLSQKLRLNWVARKILRVQHHCEKLIDKAQGGAQDILDICHEYVHLGKLIYYEDEDAMPRVLTDRGSRFSRGSKDTFRSVKYKPVDKFTFNHILEWHMDIIRGPGLSFLPKDLH